MGSWTDSKLSPAAVIHAHHATLVDARTGKRRTRDLYELWLPAAALGGLTLWRVDDFPDAAAGGLFGGLALLAAFMFSLCVQMLERADELAASTSPGPDTTRRARRSRFLAANGAYSSMVAAVASALLVGELFTDGLLGRVLGAAGVGLAVHFFLVLVMVVSRVFIFTTDRLDSARTGAGGGYWDS